MPEAAYVTKRRKLFLQMKSPARRNIRFEKILRFAERYGFHVSVRGSDYVLSHERLEYPVFVGKPHGGRDFVRPHYIDRLVEALETLMDRGCMEDLRED